MYIPAIIIFLIFVAFAIYDHNQKEKAYYEKKQREEAEKKLKRIQEAESAKRKLEEDNLIAKSFLIKKYMDLAENVANDMDNNDFFIQKYPLLLDSISQLIERKNQFYNLSSVIKRAETNEDSKQTLFRITQQAYSITFYYMFNFDEIFPENPMEDLTDLILNVLDKNDEADAEDIETFVYEKLNKHPDILTNKE